MKNYVKILTIAIVAMFAMSITVNAQDKKEAEVTFSVDIDCKNCVKKVEANLPFEKGIKDMKVDLETKTVWIKYDSSKTDKAKLEKAIEKLGYAAEEKTIEKK